MQTFKPSESDLPLLRASARMLKDANARLREAEQAVEAAKKTFSDWLALERGVNIETLSIGEIVHVDGVVLIEIGKQRKFDVRRFQVAEPKLWEEWQADLPVKKYKALV